LFKQIRPEDKAVTNTISSAIPRIAGWLAHWVEACKDPDTKIWRPRQVYEGEGKRSYVPVEHRTQLASDKLQDLKHVSALNHNLIVKSIY
jgi:hypothetical protein